MAAKKGANKLNGSVDRLAEALRDVVREAAQEAIAPMRNEITGLRKEMNAGFARIDNDIAELRGELAFARKEAELQR